MVFAKIDFSVIFRGFIKPKQFLLFQTAIRHQLVKMFHQNSFIQYRAPHVEKIAATDGMEYVLSMMYDMYERMDIRQKVFAALGIQKLSQYRKMFGVVLPREILIVDEFQQMYELATPKQSEIINQLLKMITKLVRATG